MLPDPCLLLKPSHPLSLSSSSSSAARPSVMQAAVEQPGNTTVAGSLLGEFEWLAARVLSFTDPATTCRAACVNRTFRGASASDVVWSRLLPPHSLALIRNQVDSDDEHDSDIETTTDIDDGHHQARSTLAERLLCLPTRQLFFRLCRSIPLCRGTQRYWLDPATGAECYMLSAKALNIVWGSTPQYWGWIRCSGSWFPTVAYLRSVCWFQVEGAWRQSLARGSYVVSFRLKVGGASGWERSPVKLSLQNLSSGQQTESQCSFLSHHQNSFPPSSPPAFLFSTNINNNGNNKNNNQNNNNANDTNDNHNDANETHGNDNNNANDNDNDNPDKDSNNSTSEHDDTYQDSEEEDDDENEHDDAYQHSEEDHDDDENNFPWVECDVGEFQINDDDADHPVEIMFSMRETEVLWWKSGIFVDGVTIRPTHVVNEARKGFVAPPKEN